MNKTLYTQYRRTAIAEMADWYEGFDMAGVSISYTDSSAGSPKAGDKIARNPKNHNDKWLVAGAYFDNNFEPKETPGIVENQALRIAELEAALRATLHALEWIGDVYVGSDDDAGECASCHERSYKPHAPDCEKETAINLAIAAMSTKEKA